MAIKSDSADSDNPKSVDKCIKPNYGTLQEQSQITIIDQSFSDSMANMLADNSIEADRMKNKTSI